MYGVLMVCCVNPAIAIRWKFDTGQGNRCPLELADTGRG
jgi:hypothetical protein